MKIIIIIVCVLAIIRVNEAVSGKEMRSYIANCVKDSTDANPTVACFAKNLLKVGVMDENSPIDINKFYSACASFVSDAAKLQKCKDLTNSCFEKVKAGGSITSMEQKTNYISCGVVDNKVIDLFDS